MRENESKAKRKKKGALDILFSNQCKNSIKKPAVNKKRN